MLFFLLNFSENQVAMYFIRSTGARGFVVEKDYVDIYEAIFPKWYSVPIIM